MVGQPLRDQTRVDVERAARRNRHDDVGPTATDRSRRGRCAKARASRRARGQVQECSAGKFGHGAPPARCGIALRRQHERGCAGLQAASQPRQLKKALSEPSRRSGTRDTSTVSSVPRRNIILDDSPPRELIHLPDVLRIEVPQRLRADRARHRLAVRARHPGGVEAEHGAPRHADAVARHDAEHQRAGRQARAVDHHPLAGIADIRILVDVGADPAADVVADPHGCGSAGRHCCCDECGT